MSPCWFYPGGENVVHCIILIYITVVVGYMWFMRKYAHSVNHRWTSFAPRSIKLTRPTHSLNPPGLTLRHIDVLRVWVYLAQGVCSEPQKGGIWRTPIYFIGIISHCYLWDVHFWVIRFGTDLGGIWADSVSSASYSFRCIPRYPVIVLSGYVYGYYCALLVYMQLQCSITPILVVPGGDLVGYSGYSPDLGDPDRDVEDLVQSTVSLYRALWLCKTCM